MRDTTSSLLGRSTLTTSVLDDVASTSAEIDGDAQHDSRVTIRRLAAEGLLDLGLPGSAGSYSDQIHVLSDLASVCMTTAFTAWSHRMTVEYLVVHGADADRTEIVRRADRVGSTALAGTFRAAAGVSEIPVTVSPSATGRTANGFLSWASNLHADTIVVTGVQDETTGRRSLVSFDLGRAGVEVLPITGLLALDGSKSGAMRLSNVELVGGDDLRSPFEDFIADVRPKFLLFQTAFIVGLVSASLGNLDDLRGPAVALQSEVDEVRAEWRRLVTLLSEGGLALDRGERPDLRDVLRLRLNASHLATHATRLELAVRGGSAYLAGSATARRVREALFLPVQSPTEAQLRWELGASA
ncbi:MAG: acyl-CoA/acyl-ACP dehydrogenase [Actinomycetota bacterium]|nr:acyl-CoA/acyl-ACP dehydrogenase [Actinomycetota bacterium]MDA2972314.1 acyl-CoA/acyl-ACP dehydrogenase [Actinomycetota bacterium]MDA3002110.1 acyl-CoA/acyl-ACP dehydrogenase [Actinomycetota bacterium]